MKRTFKVCLLLAAAALIGCAGATPFVVESGTEESDCLAMVERLDALVDATSVRNAAFARVAGAPMLRYDRFLAHVATTREAPPPGTWIREMQRLDLAARQSEIRNLPRHALDRLSGEYIRIDDRDTLLRGVGECSDRLVDALLQQPGAVNRITESIAAPTEYVTTLRVIGLYPITSLPVDYLTRRAHRTFRDWFETPYTQLSRIGNLALFSPGNGAGKTEAPGLSEWLSSLPKDDFGLPRLTPADRERLALALAPHMVQDIAADYDRFGAVAWEGDRLAVRTGSPTAYFYVNRSLFAGDPAFQFNFVYWYPGRRGKQAPWIEHGNLDGLTVRYTLRADGDVVMVDVMNNCGCYHSVFPARSAVLEPVPDEAGLHPFVPAWLPPEIPERRLLLRINSGWHQVDHVGGWQPGGSARRYSLVPYETLESLPKSDGTFESLFTAGGFGKGSGRIEPLILFPMGIPNVGAMRQRGHHAIKLIGRDHFDAPDLFDRHFRYR